MPHHRFAGVACSLLLASLALSARADNLSRSALARRIEALEAQLQQHEHLLLSTDGSGADTACCAGVSGCAAPCDRIQFRCGSCPAWYALGEVTVLQLLASDRDFFPVGTTFAEDIGAGQRWTVGRDFGTGMGIRGRYWMFNHGRELVPPATITTLSFEFDVVDLETTLRITGADSSTQAVASAGLRYAHLGRDHLDLSPPAVPPRLTTFEGIGPVVSLECRRDIGRRPIYLMGNVRMSLLMGDIANPSGLFAGPVELKDELMTSLESQIGVGWRRDLGLAELHLRALWETQFWLNAAYSDSAQFAGASNLALTGAALAAEFRR